MYKNSECKCQTKKMTLIPIFFLLWGFSLWGLNVFFLYLIARDWENFKFLGDLISFWEKGARPFTSMEPSMMNHLKSRIVEGKIICFMCL